jgi:D-alanyl-D-alanine carboxypeptidase
MKGNSTLGAMSELFADLGIPSDYGRDPRRPKYAEATDLMDVEPNVIGTMQRLAPETATAWHTMKASAADDGVPLLLVSGFRSVRHQADIIRRKLAAGQSIGAILAVNAAPGFSEHHTGRAVDIATPGTRPLTAEFESSAAFTWLQANAGAFGFRMPYGRRNRFGFEYEPWHWSQVEGHARRRKD